MNSSKKNTKTDIKRKKTIEALKLINEIIEEYNSLKKVPIFQKK